MALGLQHYILAATGESFAGLTSSAKWEHTFAAFAPKQSKGPAWIEMCSESCGVCLNGMRYTGWWFGTFFIFPYNYWEFHHPNWFSYFSEGWVYHQPVQNDDLHRGYFSEHCNNIPWPVAIPGGRLVFKFYKPAYKLHYHHILFIYFTINPR